MDTLYAPSLRESWMRIARSRGAGASVRLTIAPLFSDAGGIRMVRTLLGDACDVVTDAERADVLVLAGEVSLRHLGREHEALACIAATRHRPIVGVGQGALLLAAAHGGSVQMGKGAPVQRVLSCLGGTYTPQGVYFSDVKMPPVVMRLPTCMRATGYDQRGSIGVFEHDTLPLFGVLGVPDAPFWEQMVVQLTRYVMEGRG